MCDYSLYTFWKWTRPTQIYIYICKTFLTSHRARDRILCPLLCNSCTHGHAHDNSNFSVWCITWALGAYALEERITKNWKILEILNPYIFCSGREIISGLFSEVVLMVQRELCWTRAIMKPTKYAIYSTFLHFGQI